MEGKLKKQIKEWLEAQEHANKCMGKVLNTVGGGGPSGEPDDDDNDGG